MDPPSDGHPAASWLPLEIARGVHRDKAFNEKYLIESKLGSGGSGVVVAARHRELDERVAIKFLLSGVQNERAVARLRFEARAAHRIKSEHVVRIIDVCTTETGIPYIVMEYLEGLDLERMLQQSPGRQLPFPDAIEFILQACEAVAESHGLGIVHRDLKPSNLFCIHGADGLPMIKVLDFGISKLGSATIDPEAERPSILGSPRYMSPEQFDSPSDVGPRTDIWAIGVILYEILTGQMPFAETDLYKLRQRIRQQSPRPPGELRPDLPAPLGPAVMKCLEKNQDNRYANVAELARALGPFGPPRCRSSVQRILRIVEAPGVTTGALDLPPERDTTVSDVPTARSVPPRATGWGRGRVNLVFWATAAAAAALLGAWLVGRASSGASGAAGTVADLGSSSASVAPSAASPPAGASHPIPTPLDIAAAPVPPTAVEVSPGSSGLPTPAKPRKSKPSGPDGTSPPAARAKSAEPNDRPSASAPPGAPSAMPRPIESANPAVDPPRDGGSRSTPGPEGSAKTPLPSGLPHWISEIVEQRKAPK